MLAPNMENASSGGFVDYYSGSVDCDYSFMEPGNGSLNITTNGSNELCMGGNGVVPEYENPLEEMVIKVVFIILYAIVFVLAFVGNLLVIIVVLKHRRMRTITNFFLANLAVADLAVGIFCVLPNLSVNLSPHWMLGRVMCKVYYFVQAMSYTASITILTVISIERYVAIIYPLRAKQLTTMCLLRVTVILIWVLSAASGVPYLIVYDQITIPGGEGRDLHFCIQIHAINMRAYLTVNFILWYLIPLVLMTIMYSRISIVLWRTSSQAVEASKKSARKTLGPVSCTDYSTVKQGLPCRFVSNKCASSGMSSSCNASADEGVSHDECEKLMSPKTTQQRKGFCNSCTEESCLEGSSSAYDMEEDRLPNGIMGKHGKGDEIKDVRTLSVHFNGKNKKCSHVDNTAFKHSRTRVNGVYDKTTKNQVGCHGYRSKSRFVVQKEKKQENALLARRRVIRLLIAVIVSFTICVLPYHIRVLWQEWSEPDLASKWQKLLPPITFVIFYLNCGLNPMLYAFLSERFRVSLLEIVSCKDYRRQRQTSFSLRTMNSTL